MHAKLAHAEGFILEGLEGGDDKLDVTGNRPKTCPLIIFVAEWPSRSTDLYGSSQKQFAKIGPLALHRENLRTH